MGRVGQSRYLALALAVFVAGLASGCKDEPAPGGDAAPSPAAKQPSVPAAVNDGPAHQRLLAWLTPDASAVAYSRLPRDLDVAALATIFALPPRTTKLLRRMSELPAELDAIAAPDSPAPHTWLAPEALAMVPTVGSGVYVVTRATIPMEQVEAHLRKAGMVSREVDGFTYFQKGGAFPWRIVFLGEDLLGFIPAREVGSGLSPLTAARDLPPSDMRRELQKVLDEDPAAVLELFSEGPLLHLDLHQDVLGARFGLRPFRDGGLDGVILLQTQDVAASVKRLAQRDLSLEADTIAAIGRRVAFTEDGPMIQGRLQLTGDDLNALKLAP